MQLWRQMKWRRISYRVRQSLFLGWEEQKWISIFPGRSKSRKMQAMTCVTQSTVTTSILENLRLIFFWNFQSTKFGRCILCFDLNLTLGYLLTTLTVDRNHRKVYGTKPSAAFIYDILFGKMLGLIPNLLSTLLPQQFSSLVLRRI